MKTKLFGLLFLGLVVMQIPAWSYPIPYAVGNRWEYEVTETGVTVVGEGQEATVTNIECRGRAVTEILSVAEKRWNGLVYHERQVEKTERGLNAEPAEITAESMSLLSTRGIESVAEKASGMGGLLSGKWQRYSPPLLFLPTKIVPGTKWTVGVVRQEGIRMPVEAVVLARETVKVPAGAFQNCLKVCAMCTRVSGKFDFGKEKTVVRDGRYIRTMWIYPGVGIVKEDSISQLTVLVRSKDTGEEVPLMDTRRKVRELLPGYTAKSDTKESRWP